MSDGRGTEPTVLVVDEATARADHARRAGGTAGTVVIVDRPDAANLLDMVSNGVRGLVCIEDSEEYFANSVRTVARGGAFLTPRAASLLMDRLAGSHHAAPHADASLDRLTERELSVLRLLAAGRTTNDISADLGVSRATVKSHVSHILLKLGLEERVQAVVVAYRAGLVDPSTVVRPRSPLS